MPTSPSCEPVEQIFCDQCQKWTSMPCISHAKRVPDTAVFPYSVASLPNVLYLDILPDGQSGKAVFAKEIIPSLTVFGPLISVLSKRKPADVAFACGSATKAGLHFFHLESDQISNWMKFVRFAAHSHEQNLAAYEIHEASPLLSSADAASPTRTHVIFVTTKTILPGDELKVAYSKIYSQAIGCPDWPTPHPTEADSRILDAGEMHKENSVESRSPVKKFIKARPQLSVVQSTAKQNFQKLHLIHNSKTNRVQPELVKNSVPTKIFVPMSSAVSTSVPHPKNKENYADRVPKVSDARARKRRKLSDESVALPNFLPPDEDPVVNSPDNLSPIDAYTMTTAETPTVSVEVTVEPEVEGSVVIFDHGNDDLRSVPVPEELLDAGDSFESLAVPPVAQKDAVLECDVLAEMNMLKTKAHIGLSKNRRCLVCSERVWNLSDHLEKEHSEENVQALDDVCFFCRKKFKNNLSLLQHLQMVHRERAAMPDEATRMAALDFMRRTGFLQYRCVRCKKIFPKKHLLDLHSIIHNSDQADQPERKCSECPFWAETFLDLVKHTAKHQKASRKIRTPCLLCGIGVRGTPRGHMESNHPDEMKLIMATWKYQCPECRHRFARKFDLNVHVSKVHKGWQCVYCGQREPSGSGWLAFEEHLRTHKIDKKFPCLVCEKSFKNFHRLCIHIRDCHSADCLPHADMVAVANLTATVVAPELVERAIEMIRETEVFSCYCQFCKRAFASFELLDLHALQHAPTDNLEADPRRNCPACDFHAASFAELVQHTAQHRLYKDDQRPCVVCGATVARMRHHILQKHPAEMQRITEDWKHQCAECQEKFKTRGKMEFHIKVQHKGYQCWYCAKVFYNSVQFGTHVVEHSVNGQYPCPACDKILSNYPKVNNHYRKCHDATRMKTCSVCQTVCFGDNQLDEHMATRHGIVDDTGAKTKNTAAPTETTNISKRRTCNLCGKEFKNYASMHYHKSIVHLGRDRHLKPKVRTQCDECHEMFSSRQTLYNHKRWVHLGVNREKFERKRAERRAAGIPNPRYIRPRNRTAYEDFQHKCEECQLGFVLAISLIKHNETRHPEKIVLLSSSSH
ncbi:zinc finger protein 729-like isoform X2 [Paramacrobiotus metropolitanus]|uniref:zinc finger protein 729-like isoform X2 n=1 Tax=Paramacrobiotus metropolitanus TaxID=2943436 RepID=UPI0024461198|nr:zinc finger protein 729-like isoform X2 [Paramacrobiotus metropolitanus]